VEREQDVDEQLRKQADLVHVWTGGAGDTFQFRFVNASSRPVTRVVVEVDLVLVDEDAHQQLLHETLGLVMLPPTGDRPARWKLDNLTRYHPDDEDLPTGWTLARAEVTALAFRDADGRVWRRTLPDGALQQLD